MTDLHSMNPRMLQLIIEALQKSFDNMDFNGTPKEAFNIGVAKGLMARIRIDGKEYDDSWMKDLEKIIKEKLDGSK